jgi:hypothetical protein
MLRLGASENLLLQRPTLMTETIVCPKCQFEIEVTEVLATQLRAKMQAEFSETLRVKEGEYSAREAKLGEQQRALQLQRAGIDDEVKARLDKQRELLCKELTQKAKEDVALDLKSAQGELAEIRSKLQQSQTQELELRKQKRELESQKAALELEVAQRVDAEIAKARDATRKAVIEERQLKEAEKDKKISDLLVQIEELRRKAEQGSQQLQGEVQEIDLEESLRRAFSLDDVVAVSKGAFGADVKHLVRDRTIGDCGCILWESKRTKNWNNDWLAKLRDDQRAAKAQIAILVSEQLPPGVQLFSLVEGIWVTNRACAVNLATALRSGLIQIAASRRALEGQQGKMEILYNYLSSDQFKQRIEGIVEPFMTLREQLESEKRTTQTAWAKREKQLDRALASTCALYGDLGGIIGQALPTIEQLNGADVGLEQADGQPISRRIEKIVKVPVI